LASLEIKTTLSQLHCVCTCIYGITYICMGSISRYNLTVFIPITPLKKSFFPGIHIQKLMAQKVLFVKKIPQLSITISRNGQTKEIKEYRVVYTHYGL